MLKLRGQGRIRTSDLRVGDHRILLIAVRLSITKSHSIRRSKPTELPVQIEYILTVTVIPDRLWSSPLINEELMP